MSIHINIINNKIDRIKARIVEYHGFIENYDPQATEYISGIDYELEQLEKLVKHRDYILNEVIDKE